LGDTIPPAEIFTFDVAEDAWANAYLGMRGDTKQTRSHFSFALGDLDDDEIDEMVGKRVAPERVPLLCQLLKSEPFLPLRNAYLLVSTRQTNCIR
jgi:hypothetical protein